MSAPKLVRVRAANGTSNTVYNLSRYHAEWNLPRPESYKCAVNSDVICARLQGCAIARRISNTPTLQVPIWHS
jgi:hypothetical protein